VYPTILNVSANLRRKPPEVTSDAAPPNAGWTLAATMLASSLAFIDGSVINVALSSIGGDLHGNAASMQWVINAYLLPLSALLLIGGAVGDRYGRRRVLMLGTALFGLASLLCAFAPSFTVLLLARSLQGVGAAMLMPNSLGILGSVFTGESRGRAVGTWASAGAIASAVGPPLGGWLVGIAGWRAIFLINVPVAMVAILIACRFAEGERARQAAARPVGRSTGDAGAWRAHVVADRVVERSRGIVADVRRAHRGCGASWLVRLGRASATRRRDDAARDVRLAPIRRSDASDVPALRRVGWPSRAATLSADRGRRLHADAGWLRASFPSRW